MVESPTEVECRRIWFLVYCYAKHYYCFKSTFIFTEETISGWLSVLTLLAVSEMVILRVCISSTLKRLVTFLKTRSVTAIARSQLEYWSSAYKKLNLVKSWSIQTIMICAAATTLIVGSVLLLTECLFHAIILWSHWPSYFRLLQWILTNFSVFLCQPILRWFRCQITEHSEVLMHADWWMICMWCRI
jgi:hypothetical protein